MKARQDIYSRITERIVTALEQGVRPWHQPWNAEHAAGKITWPLRHNGLPYSRINVIMLWSEARTSRASAFAPATAGCTRLPCPGHAARGDPALATS